MKRKEVFPYLSRIEKSLKDRGFSVKTCRQGGHQADHLRFILSRMSRLKSLKISMASDGLFGMSKRKMGIQEYKFLNSHFVHYRKWLARKLFEILYFHNQNLLVRFCVTQFLLRKLQHPRQYYNVYNKGLSISHIMTIWAFH